MLIFNKSHSNWSQSKVEKHYRIRVYYLLHGIELHLKQLVILLILTTFFFTSFILSGPRPDLDPDVVAALDDALDLNDPDNVLDDDFVIKVITIQCHCNFVSP